MPIEIQDYHERRKLEELWKEDEKYQRWRLDYYRNKMPKPMEDKTIKHKGTFYKEELFSIIRNSKTKGYLITSVVMSWKSAAGFLSKMKKDSSLNYEVHISIYSAEKQKIEHWRPFYDDYTNYLKKNGPTGTLNLGYFYGIPMYASSEVPAGYTFLNRTEMCNNV